MGLRVIYQCGLRVGETVKIKVTIIDACQLRLRDHLIRSHIVALLQRMALETTISSAARRR